MQESKFFVGMAGDVLVLKFGVEFWVYFDFVLVFGCEDGGEGHVFVLLLRAFLRKTFWADYFGVWVGSVPFPEFDVMLHGIVMGKVMGLDGMEFSTSMSGAVIYFTSPISATVSFTSWVKETGEKTAMPPDWSLTSTDVNVAIRFCFQRASHVPSVARPPIRRIPILQNGRDRVVMFGVILRITITSDGLSGTSFPILLEVIDLNPQLILNASN